MKTFVVAKGPFQKPHLATKIAEHQKRGRICAWVDTQTDIAFLREHGIMVEDLLVSQPSNARQAREIVNTLANSGAVDVIMFGDRLIFVGSCQAPQ